MLIANVFVVGVGTVLFARLLLGDSRLAGRVLQATHLEFCYLLLITGTSSQLCSSYLRFTTQKQKLANIDLHDI